MYLKKLVLKNFRCYDKFEIENLDKLTVFIGENDAGKTVLLKAIEWLLSDKLCQEEDCFKDKDNKISDEVFVEGHFQKEAFDVLDKKYFTSKESGIFRVRKTYTAEGNKFCYFGRGYSDPEFNNFKGAAKQKALLKKYEINPANTEALRKQQLKGLVEKNILQHTDSDKREITLAEYRELLNIHLPHIRPFSASNYKTADSIVQNKLRDVARSVLDETTASKKLKKHLESLKVIKKAIEDKLEKELAEIEKTLKEHHKELKKVKVDTKVTFEDAVGASSLKLNLGDGERLLEQFGDGTKRRLWMGLLEWDTEAKNEKSSRSVIRLYDEPDVNLHYRAQKQFFENIEKLTENSNIHTQCFISTHSFSMVDRARSESLVHIRVKDNG
jgi:predicted ATP-dependent endonuclease of OLD family